MACLRVVAGRLTDKMLLLLQVVVHLRFAAKNSVRCPVVCDAERQLQLQRVVVVAGRTRASG